MLTWGTDLWDILVRKHLKSSPRRDGGLTLLLLNPLAWTPCAFSLHAHIIFWLLPSSPGFEINAGIMRRPLLWPGTDWNAWIVINFLAQVAAVTVHHFTPITAWTMAVPSGCVSLSPAHFSSLWVQGYCEVAVTNCLSLLSLRVPAQLRALPAPTPSRPDYCMGFVSLPVSLFGHLPSKTTWQIYRTFRGKKN